MKEIIKKTISGTIEIARGMLTISKHMFREPVTLEYPENKPDLGSRYKGRLALLRDSEGNELCMGCKCCMKVCPCGDLIHIETKKDENNKNVVEKFTVDIGRCIFCGNCTEVCAKGAVVMTHEFELADYSREALVFDKERLLLSTEESAKYLKMREEDS